MTEPHVLTPEELADLRTYLPSMTLDAAGMYVGDLLATVEAAHAENARLRAIEAEARRAYEAMDAACQWAAGQTSGIKTVEDADRHVAGYDALLEATVVLGMTLGVLHERVAFLPMPR